MSSHKTQQRCQRLKKNKFPTSSSNTESGKMKKIRNNRKHPSKEVHGANKKQLCRQQRKRRCRSPIPLPSDPSPWGTSPATGICGQRSSCWAGALGDSYRSTKLPVLSASLCTTGVSRPCPRWGNPTKRRSRRRGLCRDKQSRFTAPCLIPITRICGSCLRCFDRLRLWKKHTVLCKLIDSLAKNRQK